MKETNYFTREKARISKVLENKYGLKTTRTVPL